jgi:hypothetical protein
MEDTTWEDDRLVAATLTRHEADLTWPPPPVQPVDPSEVPEVQAFFWRASIATKIAAYVLGVVLVTIAGLATARAHNQLFRIDPEAAR